MKTVDAILTDVLAKEGGYSNHPADTGGPTNYGITAGVLGEWRRLGRPASREEVKKLTVGEARDIYRKRYVLNPGFTRIPNDALRAQMVDFGVNSGPARAIRWLQRAIGVPVTGVLDAQTLEAVSLIPPRVVNNALVAARLKMIDDWTDGDQGQKVFEEGIESRALSFFLG